MSFIKNLENRTFNYRFSVTDKNDPDLIALKQQVKNWNKEYSDNNRKRVTLMARGKRRNNSYNTLHKDANYFDVYVHTSINWETWQLKRRREREIQQEFIENITNEIQSFISSRY